MLNRNTALNTFTLIPRYRLLAAIALLLSAARLNAAPENGHTCTTFTVRSQLADTNLARRLTGIMASRIQARTGTSMLTRGTAACTVELVIHPQIGAQGFEIEEVSPRLIRISGNDSLGLLYGVGRFLHTNVYHDGSFTLSRWQGKSVPQTSFRAIYFATHFFNYYHAAPIGDVESYLEDLALWGYNTVIVWFDMHLYTGIDDPAARAMIQRLNALLTAAKDAGLQTGLVLIGNEAFANSPVALRADWTAGHDGYFREIRGHYHVELCPNKPGAEALLLKWREQVFQAFRQQPLNYIILWPYDQGGCTSKECKPWGTNGFLKIAQPVAELARRDFPRAKVILSTWYFDKFTSGEWDGLEKKFAAGHPAWIDSLMADDAGVKRYASVGTKRPVPGHFPLLSFPEVSMWGATPWGGFGANPLPDHHQQLWNVGKNVLDGGMPYSEGIFEDFNKVLYARFFWDKNAQADATAGAYAAYEFSPEVAPLVQRAISILELNYPRHDENLNKPGEPVRFVLDRTTDSATALKLLEKANDELPARVRTSWRWRIFYLRARIDAGLAGNDFRVSPEVEQAFEELTRIYHAQHAIWVVSPPTRAAIARYRTEGDGASGAPSHH